MCNEKHVQVDSGGVLQCVPQKLSTGEITGIVVGVAAVVLMIVGGIYLACLRKNRFQRELREDDSDPESSEIYV